MFSNGTSLIYHKIMGKSKPNKKSTLKTHKLSNKEKLENRNKLKICKTMEYDKILIKVKSKLH